MNKSFLSMIVGILIGAAAMTAVPATAAVKQFILTQIDYPVLVNGVEYKDADRPLLNYQGSTYIPLAKIGDLTGVNYVWNAEKHRVEIGSPVINGVAETVSEVHPPQEGCNVTGQKGVTLCPDTEIEWEKEPGYKGYTDSEDPSYQWALTMGREDMPPLLSEGWISEGMLLEIENIAIPISGKKDELQLVRPKLPEAEKLITLVLPSEFIESTDGDYSISGIRVKKYHRNIFFNIADLQKLNIIDD
jgi:hypothetical protein